MESFDFQTAIHQLHEIYEVDLVALAMVLPEEQFLLKWKYISGNLNQQYKRIQLRTGKGGVAGAVFKSGKPYIVSNVPTQIDPNKMYHYPILQFEQIKSFVALPLFKNHRVTAVLLVASREIEGAGIALYQRMMDELGECFGPLYLQELMTN
ncbi:GAF domain-containing protein [Gracilibacillus sp. JCM 18860]|uniref:GAF domain-containing protein n=1 Tax=Gracilibacillus sp. JCM 18860 TaxID=1306159 RepID=UPI000A6EEC6B